MHAHPKYLSEVISIYPFYLKTRCTSSVIASEAKQSILRFRTGLPRRFAPRNDGTPNFKVEAVYMSAVLLFPQLLGRYGIIQKDGFVAHDKVENAPLNWPHFDHFTLA